MGKGDSIAHPGENRQQALQPELPQGFPIPARQIIQHCFQRAPLHQLHGVKQRLALLPDDIMDRHDIGVLQHGEDAHLAQEALADPGIIIRIQRHQFRRHRPLEFTIHGLDHRRHASVGDFLPQFIIVSAHFRFSGRVAVCWRSGFHGIVN
jgi:hypothetical protein